MKKIYLFVLIFWCLLISCSKMSTGEKGEQYCEKGDLKKALNFTSEKCFFYKKCTVSDTIYTIL